MTLRPKCTSLNVKPSVVIGKHKTSIELEDALWLSVKEVAAYEEISVSPRGEACQAPNIVLLSCGAIGMAFVRPSAGCLLVPTSGAYSGLSSMATSKCLLRRIIRFSL
jgi:hypothetical protein